MKKTGRRIAIATGFLAALVLAPSAASASTTRFVDSMWHELLTQPWWKFDPIRISGWGLAYRWFNFFEAGVWLMFAILVFGRWVRTKNSPLELIYAAAFLTFGLTDVREGFQISFALVAIKGVNLILLLALRWQVMRRWYPTSRVF